MAEYIERAAAVKVVLRERKPTNSVAQNRMLSIIQRDLLTMRAAYEDTGLEPEQCENAKAIIESAFSNDTSKAERIRELSEADKAGRLVVLPCKPGDTVYMISWRLNGRHKIEERVFSLTYFDPAKCGKDYFLTRKEAEKALEELE